MEAPSSAGTHYHVAATWEIRIDKEADIVEVRQRTRELAKEHRFDQFAVAALTTAASELSRNVWVHAQNGIARITVFRNGNRVGLRLEFVDHEFTIDTEPGRGTKVVIRKWKKEF